MPVQLGAKPNHGFDEPLGLLSDCHRRIERFLDVLIALLPRTVDRPLTADERQALATALDYFKTAAPRHTADEEQSLFPLMRQSPDAEVRAAVAELDALEVDHRDAEIAHDEVDRIGRAWLHDGNLPGNNRERLQALLARLRQTYRRHIAIEDERIFPLAGRVLSAEQLAVVGRQMADRRGL